jgi:hypothetical protein
MGRKTKYTPDRVELVLSVIKQTGSQTAACEAADICQAVFYNWQKKYPEFVEALTKAKEEFQKKAPDAIIQQANEVLRNYLFDGHTETWETTEIHKDASGNVTRVVEQRRKINRPTPEWVINRVFGKQIPLLEAMNVLLAEGVATLDQVQIVRTGLTQIEQRLRQASPYALAPVSDAQNSKS